MPWTGLVAPLVMMLLFQLALPVYLIHDVWRSREETRTGWWLAVAAAVAYVIAVLLTGRWDWLSHYLRFGLVALLVAAAVTGHRRVRSLPWLVNGRPGGWLATASALFVIVGMLVIAGLAVRGFFFRDAPVELALPLRDGAFYVGQGGDSRLLNYHNVNPAQRYALDVVQINAVGARASLLFSTDLERYEIFGTPVYSPCDGVVVAAADGLPDRVPPQADREHPSGNHVVIGCRGVRVLLAHLQNGSVRTTTGSHVASGTPLARVGNSGNTSEPHLHVHAVRDDGDILTGDGVPIVFDGEFGVRNTIFRR